MKILVLLVLSFSIPSFADTPKCLSEEERKQLDEISDRYELAKQLDPSCEQGRGATECLRPRDGAALRFLEAKLDKCEAENPIYIHTVETLANGTCPTFERFLSRDVALVFESASFNEPFFERLKSAVAQKSEGRVLLAKDSPSEHRESCRCLDVTHARLTGVDFKVELLFMPGIFRCEPRVVLESR